jgi:hypothetical protein
MLRQHVNRLTCAAVLLVLGFAFGTVSALAQSAVTGAIGGSVTDPNNAAIPGATATLRNLNTNKEETTTTSSEGQFRFTNLQPGTYRLTITASGFIEFRQEGILVEVGRLTNIDASLKITGAEATIEIVADTPTINTESKDFSSNINQTAINELPINGRRWSNFALLTPGSVADGNFGLISFRGISGLLNNNTVDGGDNNQAFFSEERGRTRISYSISQSSIREFQVNTSNYSAEYGRAAGGVVNAVTKSGTNEFHGDLFYYQRNNDWGARNPLAFRTVLVGGSAMTVGIKPEDVRHQFGGTIGGPIVKDRLFFFFSYDQQKRNFPGLAIFSNPNYLNTVNRTALRAAPRGLTDAQIDTALSFLNSVSGPVPRKGDQTLVLPKIDWQVTSKHLFSATYNRLRWDSPAGIQTQPTNTRGIASFGDDFVKIDWGTARLQSTITNNLLNEFRFQYARDFEFQTSQTPAPGEPRTALNGSSPSVVLTNGLEFGKPDFLERRAFPDEKRWQYTDNVTYSTGQRTIKFGVDINHVKDVLDNLRFESGGYGYNNINDFIIDYTNFLTPLPATVTCTASSRVRGRCYTSNFLQGFGPTASEISTTDFNAYFQIDWKYSQRVTMNLGLRYEYQSLPDARNPNPSNAVIPNTALTLNQATSQLPNDKNNFGPRVGFAIDLTGDGRTSLRGGYGLYYGRMINSTIFNALINTGAPGGQFQINLSPAASTAPIFPNVLTSAPAGSGAIQYFATNFSNPMIHQADLIFERQIARNTAVSASYLLSIGRRLPTFIDRNLGVPNETRNFAVSGGPFNGQTAAVRLFPTTRPITTFAQITEIQSSVKSQYNALVLQANRRFSNGLQFIASYTLSKATDNNQTSTTFTTNNVPFDVFNPDFEYGTSNFDVRHKFVVSAVIAPRFDLSNKFTDLLVDGWSIAPIFQYYSGRPFSGFVSGSSGGAGSLNRSGGANRFPLVERNSFREPDVWNVDLRLSRKFYLKEKVSFEVLGEAFNLFNRTQVTQVNGTFYNLNTATNTLTFNTAFNQITAAGGTLFRERQVQVAARFQF